MQRDGPRFARNIQGAWNMQRPRGSGIIHDLQTRSALRDIKPERRWRPNQARPWGKVYVDLIAGAAGLETSIAWRAAKRSRDNREAASHGKRFAQLNRLGAHFGGRGGIRNVVDVKAPLNSSNT